LQLLFDQLFTRPTDQPRHATLIDGNPVVSMQSRLATAYFTPKLSVKIQVPGELVILARRQAVPEQAATLLFNAARRH
jgi:hypothetical protein